MNSSLPVGSQINPGLRQEIDPDAFGNCDCGVEWFGAGIGVGPRWGKDVGNVPVISTKLTELIGTRGNGAGGTGDDQAQIGGFGGQISV